MLEAERDRLSAENESLRTRMAKQAGALEESRAQVRQMVLRNENLSALIAKFEKHFRDFHGSAENIHAQMKELALEPTTEEIVNAPAQVATIKDRIARIMKRDEATTNGTNGNA
jgi:chromosome segregation ATPase